MTEHFFPLTNLGLGELAKRGKNQLSGRFLDIASSFFRLSFAMIKNDCHASLPVELTYRKPAHLRVNGTNGLREPCS
jgi:hypothetical protein